MPPFTEPIAASLIGPGGRMWRQDLTGGTNQLDYTALFQPGDYLLELTSKGPQPGLDDYQLTLSRADPFVTHLDREPNDTPETAIWDWPADNRLVGSVGGGSDADNFGLTVAQVPATLRVCNVPDTLVIKVSQAPTMGGEELKATREDEGGNSCLSLLVPTAGDYIVGLTRSSTAKSAGLPISYDFELEISTIMPEVAEAAPKKLQVSLEKAPATPRAFLTNRTQHLSVILTSSEAINSSSIANLTLHSSSPGWRLVGPSELDAADNQIRAELAAPADLDPEPVRLGLMLEMDGYRGRVFFELTPDPDAPAVNPQRGFPIPKALLGGLNVASSALGARMVDADGVLLAESVSGLRDPAALIDGVAPSIETFSFGPKAIGTGITVDLAGEEPVPLAGIILTARNGFDRAGTLHRFRVDASEDGKTFIPVLNDKLSPGPAEQSFTFDQSIVAKALRLIPLSSWRLGGVVDDRVHLSEMRVVAQPGFLPAGVNEFNLVDPEFGGHVVWARPELDVEGPWNVDLLTGGDEKPDSLRNATEVTVVLGFHHARVARLTALGWDVASIVEPGQFALPKDLTAEISVAGPLGPWKPAGRWELLPETAPDNPMRLNFPQPVEARHLRLTIRGDDGSRPLRLPDRLFVWEERSSEERPSILCEWGEFSADASWVPALRPSHEYSGGTTPENAPVLPPGQWQSSAVLRGERENWWVIETVEAPAQLRLDLDTFGRSGVRAALADPGGAAVDIVRDTKEPDHFMARLEMPGRYLLRLFEPRQALIVAYDTSGSTQPYRAQLRRALFDIAEAADPSRDLVGFLPFGDALLGGNLTGEPEELLRRLTAYAGNVESSAAETALGTAADILSSHDGARAVILMTDAATSRDPALWPKLKAARPLVAAVAIPATVGANSSAARERDLMESWAMVAGGSYDYVATQGDFRSAFERARARLQTPKSYRLRATLEKAKPLVPGSLRVEVASVTSDAPSSETDSALMILLDNSGSMLKQLDGRRRYQIAQDALATLLRDLPEGQVSVGLRLFGLSPDECETTLLTPPGPPQATLDAITGIKPQNLARTPIAMALKAAAEDLAGFQATRRIIVLSDGEETCDQDPGAVIARLRDEGISTRIDIVGFQIADPVLSAQFKTWAEAGGGAYWDTANADDLAAALVNASRPTIRVTAQNGTVLSTQLGDPDLSLVPGRYLVAFDGQVDGVEVLIKPDELTTAILEAP